MLSPWKKSSKKKINRNTCRSIPLWGD